MAQKMDHWKREATKYAGILERFHIPVSRHALFAEFVETGMSSPAFMAYFDTDADCQQAVEKAFALRIGHLQGAIRALKRTEVLVG